MDSPVVPMVMANLCATGCALLLVRRGPNPRLRLLTLIVGLMSLSQTTHFLYEQRVWAGGELYLSSIHHNLVAALSLLALYLLAKEVCDRNLTDRRLRLAEFDAQRCGEPKREGSIIAECEPSMAPALEYIPQPNSPMTNYSQVHAEAHAATVGMLYLLQRVTAPGVQHATPEPVALPFGPLAVRTTPKLSEAPMVDYVA